MNGDKKKKVDWIELRALAIAVILTRVVRDYIFAEKLVNYSLWTNILITIVLYAPIYYLMIFIQKKLKSKK